eukprot:CAMPEP_0173300134 /NCGR_PEP_ID=MMETSP1143-20121109/17061_1 /TAXON_ID=483371 /ORGANISM="non described non described, Strain CCMP2298" /LENGTH=48 /DNA_ID= /DNA_START= /DNA_END= /DNA_ORIENTATION=
MPEALEMPEALGIAEAPPEKPETPTISEEAPVETVLSDASLNATVSSH